MNLIDTPGHVDFNYEVSRSLAACEGAVLVVDASQGMEAQTLANTYLAIDAGLEVLPVINKIDLPAARPDRGESRRLRTSSASRRRMRRRFPQKTGINIHAVLERDCFTTSLPPPATGPRPSQALIFDSQYDAYRGVIVYLRVKEGTIRPGMDVKMMATGAVYKVVEVGAICSPLGLAPRTGAGSRGGRLSYGFH